jgi:hypothetical protein
MSLQIFHSFGHPLWVFKPSNCSITRHAEEFSNFSRKMAMIYYQSMISSLLPANSASVVLSFHHPIILTFNQPILLNSRSIGSTGFAVRSKTVNSIWVQMKLRCVFRFATMRASLLHVPIVAFGTKEEFNGCL